jgi:dTDP-4-dehydrorhamnose 3,5-epimerase
VSLAQPARTPGVWPNADVSAAFAAARERIEPVFVPVAWYVDDRGASLMNQLQGVMTPEGQINFSVQNPGVIKAWHRHQKQTDFWMCVAGHLKVGVHRESDGASWVIVTGERRPGVVIIPPPLWHGAATVGDRPASLMYYLTHRYDPAHPDEDRRAFDSVEGFPWGVQHR